MSSSSDILISLCIPTYNRAALLDQALRAIADQAAQELSPAQRRLVEIFISDNHSTDDTTTVIEQAAAGTDLRVTSFRQPENRGGDANILNAMQNGHGEFVLLLSDDDILLPGALAKLLDLIGRYPDADGFCLNTKPFVVDVHEEGGPSFRLPADQRLQGRDLCLQFLGTEITFLSVLAFRRTRVAGRDYAPRIGTLLLQSYVYLDLLAEDPEIVVTQKPFLAVRGYNSGGFSFFEVFVTQFRALMDYALSVGFADRTVETVLARHLRRYLTPYAVVMRVRDSYGTFEPDWKDAARRLRAAYGRNPFLLLVLLPALSAPRGLVRGVHAGLKRAKSLVNSLRSRGKSGKSSGLASEGT